MLKNFQLIFFLSIFLLNPVPAFAKKLPTTKIMQQAEQKEKAGDYEGAQILYESILKHHPDFLAARLSLGQVHYWQGNYEAAIAAYKIILDKNPDHVEALVGTGKAYLALGNDRQADKYFQKAKKLDPEHEEVKEITPQLAKKTRIRITGGYIMEDLSYAGETQGEYQEIEILKEKSYGIGLNNTYLRRFGSNALDTRIFGHYHFTEKTKVGGGITFAPKATALPKQSYTLGAAQTFWKLTPEASYLFKDYSQANLHEVVAALTFEPLEWMRLRGGYEFQRLQRAGANQNFHSGFGDIKFGIPFHWFSFSLFYKRIERGFEAGRPGGAFVNYSAHAGGGKIGFEFVTDYSLYFETFQEGRSNGETIGTYILSFGYVF